MTVCDIIADQDGTTPQERPMQQLAVQPRTTPDISPTATTRRARVDAAGPPGPRMPFSRMHAAIWLGIALLSLWIRAGFPVKALGWGAADDALFIRSAGYLATGHWLGPYDNLTLAKGMFYPLFIAATALAGVPLKFAEHAVYLAASMGAAAYAGRQGGQRWLGTAVFAALAFNPVFWDHQLARVFRDCLYISLGLAIVLLAAWVCFYRGREIGRFALAVGLGAVTGAFWLTREEGLWIVPALATVALIAAGTLLAAPAAWGERARRLARLGAPLVLAGLVAAASVQTVAMVNGRVYGVAVTTEFKSREFVRAYGALAGIHQDQWRRYVVFPHDARMRAYAASPAARELAPFFEGAGGDGWRRAGCTQMWTPLEACPEILSGWFMWALRDAVTSAGHGASATDARAFYGRLASEIGWACDRGGLACDLPHRATLAPPFHWEYLGETVQAAKDLAAIVFTLGGGAIQSLPSEGTPAQIAAFTDLIGPVSPLRGAPDTGAAPVTRLRMALEHRVAHAIYPVYGYGTPVLFALGTVGVVAGLVRRRALPAPLLALMAASLVAVASRIALLAYLDATSIPSVNTLYSAPASPFVIMAAVLGSYACALAWTGTRARSVSGQDLRSGESDARSVHGVARPMT